MKSHELIAKITRETAKINEKRLALKDKEIARLMDQVANLKSENKDLQEAFNYVATDFKNFQKDLGARRIIHLIIEKHASINIIWIRIYILWTKQKN